MNAKARLSIVTITAVVTTLCSFQEDAGSGVIAAEPPAPEAQPERPEIVLQVAQRDVTALEISADGRLLATGDRQGAIVIWDLATGRRLRKLRGHVREVRALQFSPDGTRLLSIATQLVFPESEEAAHHHVAVLWDVASGKMLRHYRPDWLDYPSGNRIEHRADDLLYFPGLPLADAWRMFLCIAFTPDGRQFIAADPGNNLVLIDVETGRLIRRYPGHNGRTPMEQVAVDSSGRFVVAVDNTALIVWRLETGRAAYRLPPIDPKRGCSFAISGDGKILATSESKADPDHISFWQLETGRRIGRIARPDKRIASMALNHDGSRLLFETHDLGAVMLDTATGKQLGVYKPRYHIDLVKFVDDRPLALDSELNLMDVETSRPMDAIVAPTLWNAEKLVFSHDGTRFAVGEGNGAAIWDAATGECLVSNFRTSGFEARQLAFTPDDRYLLGGTHKYGDGAAVFLWDAQSAERIPRFPLDIDKVVAVDVSDGGRAMTAARDGKAYLWDIDTGKIEATLVQPPNKFGKPGNITAAALSHNGRYVALYGYASPELNLWDLSGERPRRIALAGIPDTYGAMLAFDPRDERLLVVSEEGTVYCWDLKSRRRTAYFRIKNARFHHAEFLPDGKRIFVASDDDRARIIDLESKTVLRTFRQDHMCEVAVSPDGRRILSSNTTGTNWLWDIESGRVLAAFFFYDSGREWLVITPEGYYDGTPAARRMVMRRTGDDLFAVEGCEELFQPDRVAASLRGE